MKVVRQDQTKAQPNRGPIFIGDVLGQGIVSEDDAKLLRVTAITFQQGARNKWHHHAADQVLVVTDGQGIVANEQTEHHVTRGDIIFIPAGERHWHGAEPNHDFTHLSILTPGEMMIDEG